MTKTLVAILLFGGIVSAFLYLSGFRLTAADTLPANSLIIGVADFPGGRAFLARGFDGKNYVGVARKWGWLWKWEGRGPELSQGLATAAPAPLTTAVLFTSWNHGRHSVTVLGGLRRDKSVAQIVSGGKTISVSDKDYYLFVWPNQTVYTYLPAHAKTADGTILYDLTKEYPLEWRVHH